MDDTKIMLEEVTAQWQPDAKIDRIDVIAPDASLRRYYRIVFAGAAKPVVAMVFDSNKPAEVGAGPSVNSDEAYVELTKYFLENGWPVPELYFQSDDGQVLLIEDLGGTLLCYSVVGSRANSYNGEQRDTLYKQAVELIVELQKMPRADSFFPFQRSFDDTLYLKEIDEFREFVYLPQRPGGGKQELLDRLFAELVAALGRIEQTLVHRDFHSWNLLIDSEGRLRIIDFQDACLGTRAYDLAALLNDRDTDTALGADRCKMLLEYFIDCLSLGDEFYDEYYLTLLQRDLKVAGRFSKLVQVRGLMNYEEWIPGTMRRIGRTLELLSERGVLPTSGAVLGVLEEMFSEVRDRRA